MKMSQPQCTRWLLKYLIVAVLPSTVTLAFSANLFSETYGDAFAYCDALQKNLDQNIPFNEKFALRFIGDFNLLIKFDNVTIWEDAFNAINTIKSTNKNSSLFLCYYGKDELDKEITEIVSEKGKDGVPIYTEKTSGNIILVIGKRSEIMNKIIEFVKSNSFKRDEGPPNR